MTTKTFPCTKKDELNEDIAIIVMHSDVTGCLLGWWHLWELSSVLKFIITDIYIGKLDDSSLNVSLQTDSTN